jgi:hemolysin activation/secretion protein
MTFEAARAQYLSDKAFLLARLVAQATNESVVAGEQFGIGGANSVRGFSQAVYSGDDGGQISLEARMATSKEQLEKLQFVTFVDLGHISVKKPVLGQVGKKTIVGGGVGFRAYPIEGLFIMADFGFPLGGKTDNDDSFVPYLKLTRSF